jgi:hypothetical protein
MRLTFWAAWTVALCATTGLALAQTVPSAIPGAQLSELSAEKLLGVALVGSLGIIAYMGRAIMARQNAMIESNIVALTRVADAIGKCENSKHG